MGREMEDPQNNSAVFCWISAIGLPEQAIGARIALWIDHLSKIRICPHNARIQGFFKESWKLVFYCVFLIHLKVRIQTIYYYRQDVTLSEKLTAIHWIIYWCGSGLILILSASITEKCPCQSSRDVRTCLMYSAISSGFFWDTLTRIIPGDG